MNAPKVDNRDLLIAVALLAIVTEALIASVGIALKADPTHIIGDGAEIHVRSGRFRVIATLRGFE